MAAEERVRDMEVAAEQAQSELRDLIEEGRIDPASFEEIKGWIKRNFLGAGYKRLCKIILGKFEV